MDMLTEMLELNLQAMRSVRMAGHVSSPNPHPPVTRDGEPCRCGERVVLGGITWRH